MVSLHLSYQYFNSYGIMVGLLITHITQHLNAYDLAEWSQNSELPIYTVRILHFFFSNIESMNYFY